MKNTAITFRIDDIGASTKYYNQHGKKLFRYKGIPFFYFPLANFWFFKRIRPFRKWAIYEEISAPEWEIFLEIFRKNKVVPIIAITATWVDEKDNLIPFPEKFPTQAEILKKAYHKNEIIIANHGLTHCITGKHLPRFWGSNRKYHREFWPELGNAWHKEHIEKSQKILESFFEKPIRIFVPPGNIWSKKTLAALKNTNIQKIICNRYMVDSNTALNKEKDKIEFIKDDIDFFNFHDRELKLYGATWLKNQISRLDHRADCP